MNKWEQRGFMYFILGILCAIWSAIQHDPLIPTISTIIFVSLGIISDVVSMFIDDKE